MKDQVLSIEQMQELMGLGVDTSKASMFWHPAFYRVNGILDYDGYEDIPRIKLVNNYDLKYDIPTFTLQDILEMLPKTIEAFKDGSKLPLMITITGSSKYAIVYCNPFYKNGKVGLTISDTLLEAAFNMLKWCKQNNII